MRQSIYLTLFLGVTHIDCLASHTSHHHVPTHAKPHTTSLYLCINRCLPEVVRLIRLGLFVGCVLSNSDFFLEYFGVEHKMLRIKDIFLLQFVMNIRALN